MFHTEARRKWSQFCGRNAKTFTRNEFNSCSIPAPDPPKLLLWVALLEALSALPKSKTRQPHTPFHSTRKPQIPLPSQKLPSYPPSPPLSQSKAILLSALSLGQSYHRAPLSVESYPNIPPLFLFLQPSFSHRHVQQCCPLSPPR